jgi:oxygen-independent coproporphyrinogen-3 oxidase
MLRLRLSDGIIYNEYENRFGSFPCDWKQKAEKLSAMGYVKLTDKGFALTNKGFLVSNAVIGEFI